MTSLQQRIGLAYSILIGVALILLGYILSSYLSSFYMESLERNLQETALLLAQEETLTREWGVFPDSETRLTVIDLTGKVVFESEKPPEELEDHSARPEIIAAYRGETGSNIRHSATTGQEMLYVAVPIKDPSGEVLGVVRVARTLTLINQRTNQLRTIIFSAILIMLVFIWSIGFFLLRSLTGSLRNLAQKARSIGGGEFPRPFPVSSRDEIGQLEMVFNEMSHNLHELVRNIEGQKEQTLNIIKNLPVGVIVIDRNGTIQASNKTFFQLLRVKPPATEGVHLLNLTHEPDLIDFLRGLWDKTKGSREKEISLDNPYRHLRFSASALDTEERNMVIVLQDLTKIKLLENTRKEFVANVSHELRTPLTAIQGFAETLRHGAWKEQDAMHFLEIIEKESTRLSRLIDDLLILSRLEAAEKIPGGPSNLAHCTQAALEILSQVAKTKNIEIKTSVAIDLDVDLNEDDLIQVILNLTGNAITHSPENSALEISAGKQESEIFWSVKDQGPGIPYEDQPRIFERFYRVDKARSRDSGGTGLGLSIVRHITEQAGGKITLESTPGKGSTFTVLLPAYKKLTKT